MPAGSSGDKSPFVVSISRLVLANLLQAPASSDPFPMRMRINDFTALLPGQLADVRALVAANSLSARELTPDTLEVVGHHKAACSRVVERLLEQKIPVSFDYSDFVSHPGTLFVRGLLRENCLPARLLDYFNAQSLYRSVHDVNVIALAPEDAGDDVSAILKFDNYLDVDHILDTMPLTPNPFHPTAPLYLNRYISKKERSMLRELPAHEELEPKESAVLYDAIVIENLNDFMPGAVSFKVVQDMLSKFALFHEIDRVWFPVADPDVDKCRMKRVGYIGFAHGKDSDADLLRCLYYLNNLTLQEVLDFSADDIYDILLDIDKSLPPQKAPEASCLKLSIAQRKHNHHLFQYGELVYLGLGDGVTLSFVPVIAIDPIVSSASFEATIINRFLKGSNYQETNVYVNNFPVVFENSDELWHEFWNQFGVGKIKSAKIIKPQFYSRKADDSLGKIGFVFYEDFKMALRAIILTNNKVIWYENHPNILIQASFAIQKNSHSQSGAKNAPLKLHHPNSLPNYNYFPAPEGPYSKRVSLPLVNESNFYYQESGTSPPPSPPFMNIPDAYMFNPYMMPMPAFSPPGIPGDDKQGDAASASSSPKAVVDNLASPPLQGSGFHPQYGYYFPYFPYSTHGHVPPMPLGGLALASPNQGQGHAYKEAASTSKDRRERKKS